MTNINERGAGEKPRPWGFWATIAFTVVVIVANFAVQMAVVIPFAVAEATRKPGADTEELAAGLKAKGLAFSLATWASSLACLGLIGLFVKPRNQLTGKATRR